MEIRRTQKGYSVVFLTANLLNENDQSATTAKCRSLELKAAIP